MNLSVFILFTKSKCYPTLVKQDLLQSRLLVERAKQQALKIKVASPGLNLFLLKTERAKVKILVDLGLKLISDRNGAVNLLS